MKTRWTGIATTALFAALAAGANAAESGLLGIKLFDSGVAVVTRYGNPDEIQAVNIGGGGAAGGGGSNPGGPGASSGPGGMPGGQRGPGGGGRPGGATPGIGSIGEAPGFSFGDYVLRQGMLPPPGSGGPGPQGPGGSGPSMGGGAPSMGGGSAENATFTRWVYNKLGSKYSFIIDQKGRVVQIEAIGLNNSRVRTSKGVSFGHTFASVIKKYRTPDGYDISGNNVMARYLTRNKVAFRFSRLGPNKPQVVTGIVVAAGKG